MANLADRITVDPEQCGGRPCIRGMRIRVTDVLDLLANGLTSEQLVDELPDLEPEDVQACLQLTGQRPDLRSIAAIENVHYSLRLRMARESGESQVAALLSAQGVTGGLSAGNLSEYCASHESGTARIVVIEQPAG